MSRAERALAANRRLQDRLRGILEAIDGALWSNAQMQAKLMHNTWLHPRAGRYRGMRGVPLHLYAASASNAVKCARGDCWCPRYHVLLPLPQCCAQQTP